MRSLLLACALLLSAPCCMCAQSGASPSHHRSTLRIGLWTLWHDKSVNLASVPNAEASLRLCVAAVCIPTPLARNLNLEAHGSKLALSAGRVADSADLTGTFTLSAHGETLTVHNPVRISARNGVLILGVTLPFESYVERVVASESGSADSLNSLKALAIVVRSFALHQAHGHADYDLCDSTHCQLLHWAGSSGHRSAAHAATLATAGETLWYHGKRAAAWFHQNCGGRTAAPSEIWRTKEHGREAPQEPMPWLVSRVDPYCVANGPREWSNILSLSDLSATLAAAGLAPSGWSSLTVARRGESGRAETLLVGNVTVSAEDFRLAIGRSLGWNRILSDWFEVSRQGSEFFFHGRGSGHGVGLCQAGAAAMAAQGRAATEILAQYFPGTNIADENTGLSWKTFEVRGLSLETLRTEDKGYLSQINQALAEAESRSGLQFSAPITVRTFDSTSDFRESTLAPGWVAAFTEGNFIATQPFATLAARKLLVSTLRHEFLHALVESQAASSSPLWLREGLVELWSEGPAARETRGGSGAPLQASQIESALAHPSSEAQSLAAHNAARLYTQKLMDRSGRVQVLAWLRSGLPADLQTFNP